MIKASEARALAQSFDAIARELEMIEVEIKDSAEMGKYSTWWFPNGRLARYSYGTLKARLEEAGYAVSIEYGCDKFYIDWRANHGTLDRR